MRFTMETIDILLPTCNRLPSLIMTLSGIAVQDQTNIRLVISDQSKSPASYSQVVQTLLRVIQVRGGSVEQHYRSPSRGIAEQRDFLLSRACADYILYLDDDVLIEPWVLSEMLKILRREGCGFVGAFPSGLSFKRDIRPAQQKIEYWNGPVEPEIVEPGSKAWERWQLHRAANLYHVSQALPPGITRLYKVAWVASCVLYDRHKLLEVGGFSFWSRLPRYHSGEEVLVQNLMMRRWGGCAMIPSGTYYAEMPSTVLNPKGTVDGHALDLLPEMVERYAPPPAQHVMVKPTNALKEEV